MDLFNRILVGRWQSPMVRLFGMKSIGSPVPTLAPEIAPSIDVNQRDDATMAFLRSERLAGAVDVAAAAVGTFSQAWVRNPSSSGLLFEIEAIQASAANNVLVGLALTTTDFISVNPFFRDGRWLSVNGSMTPAAKVSQTTSTVPSGYLVGRILANSTGYQPFSLVVPPGMAAFAYVGTANVAMTFGFLWRERPFDPSELQTG